jgi:hypothetical protein
MFTTNTKALGKLGLMIKFQQGDLGHLEGFFTCLMEFWEQATFVNL